MYKVKIEGKSNIRRPREEYPNEFGICLKDNDGKEITRAECRIYGGRDFLYETDSNCMEDFKLAQVVSDKVYFSIPVIVIEKLITAPEYYRKGYGSKIIKELEKVLLGKFEDGCYIVFNIEPIRNDGKRLNPSLTKPNLKKFYKKNGFDVVKGIAKPDYVDALFTTWREPETMFAGFKEIY